jgi:hypothetical protein
MSATQKFIAPRNHWGPNDGLVPTVPALIARHPGAKPRDPEEITLMVTQRDPSTTLGMTTNSNRPAHAA